MNIKARPSVALFFFWGFLCTGTFFGWTFMHDEQKGFLCFFVLPLLFFLAVGLYIREEFRHTEEADDGKARGRFPY